METTEIISQPKGILSLPEKFITHKKESTHLHPDVATALKTVGHDIRLPPESGIGRDPRQAFEDAHWTGSEKEGYRAYVNAVKNDPSKMEGSGPAAARVGRMANFWTDNERIESPKRVASLPSIQPKSSISERTKSLRQGSTQPTRENSVHHENQSQAGSQHQDRQRPISESSAKENRAASEQSDRPRSISDRIKAWADASAQRPKESYVRKGDDSPPAPKQQEVTRKSVSERINSLEEISARQSKKSFVAKGVASQSTSERPERPKGPVADRAKALEETSARQLKGSSVIKEEKASETSRESTSDRIKSLSEASARKVEETRPAGESISFHLSVKDEVDRITKPSKSVSVEAGQMDPQGADGKIEVNILRPKLTHPTKNRALHPAKNRL